VILFFVVLSEPAWAGSRVDVDGDGDTDLRECQAFQNCLSIPDVNSTETCCEPFDVDGNGAINLVDWPSCIMSLEGPDRQNPVLYKLDGMNFSAFAGNQDPNRGAAVSESQVRHRLSLIAPYVEQVRIFSTRNGHQYVGPAARRQGVRIAAGAWIGRNLAANNAEISSLIEMAKAGYVDLAIVGSEALLRRDVSGDRLVSYLNQVKEALPDVPVTTADVSSVLLEHPLVIDACDVLFVNYYPYWEGIGVQHAVAAVHRQHQRVRAAAIGKTVIVSESGWPSCGNTIRDAVPSPENARYYLLNLISWARAENVPYFYFEAFDEPWKALYEGPQGKCWGLWGECAQLKPWVYDVFSNVSTADNWSGTQIVDGLGDPSIALTFVPAYGRFDDLRGQVRHVAPAQYNVAVYIYVGSGWWTKPYWNEPLTQIWPDGDFLCDITTGGADQNATVIRVYLLSAGYSPPLMTGQGALPAELLENAAAWTEVTRAP
jgi:exo-beta-1,3-glucanase (GH17 family)